MAQSAFLVVFLLLALTESRVDCTYNCKGAKFGKNANKFDEFVENCAPKTWKRFFQLEDVKEVITVLSSKLKNRNIQPQMPLTFKALELVPPSNIKVVIVGQDPTPQKGKATGLAFSVEDPRKVVSVMNVLLEVALEGWSVNLKNGDLTKWAKQGVLLLNAALTVQVGKAGSHSTIWKPFTKLLIEHISIYAQPSVWLLWGGKAQEYQTCINPYHEHYVITGGHPSPLGGLTTNTFFGKNYFRCANKFLRKKRDSKINWGLMPVQDEKRLDVKSSFDPCPPERVLLKLITGTRPTQKQNRIKMEDEFGQ